MATNPMQRKARNSFLLGMLVTLIIATGVIALLFMQLKKVKEEQQKEIQERVSIYVLNADVKSGEIFETVKKPFGVRTSVETLIYITRDQGGIEHVYVFR